MAEARGIDWLTPTDHSIRATKRRALLKVNQDMPKMFLSCTVKKDSWNDVKVVAVKQLKGNVTIILNRPGKYFLTI